MSSVFAFRKNRITISGGTWDTCILKNRAGIPMSSVFAFRKNRITISGGRGGCL